MGRRKLLKAENDISGDIYRLLEKKSLGDLPVISFSEFYLQTDYF